MDVLELGLGVIVRLKGDWAFEAMVPMVNEEEWTGELYCFIHHTGIPRLVSSYQRLELRHLNTGRRFVSICNRRKAFVERIMSARIR